MSINNNTTVAVLSGGNSARDGECRMILINKKLYVETKVRKVCSCSRCESVIKKGEQAYRPKLKPTVGKNRTDRICSECGSDFVSREDCSLEGVKYVQLNPRFQAQAIREKEII